MWKDMKSILKRISEANVSCRVKYECIVVSDAPIFFKKNAFVTRYFKSSAYITFFGTKKGFGQCAKLFVVLIVEKLCLGTIVPIHRKIVNSYKKKYYTCVM